MTLIYLYDNSWCRWKNNWTHPTLLNSHKPTELICLFYSKAILWDQASSSDPEQTDWPFALIQLYSALCFAGFLSEINYRQDFNLSNLDMFLCASQMEILKHALTGKDQQVDFTSAVVSDPASFHHESSWICVRSSQTSSSSDPVTPKLDQNGKS